jgi:type VI protein secretion system component VasK
MRRVNRWVARRRETDAQQAAASLDQIVEQATIIYGEGYAPPSRTWRQGFLRMQFEYADDPQGLIAALRQLIENQSDTAT